MNLKKWIRTVEDYPIGGVLFRDITPLLAYPPAFKRAVQSLSELLTPFDLEAICAIDARGFLFGAPVSLELDLPVIPVRKAGKLPPEVTGIDYVLEYGRARIEIGKNILQKKQRVAIIDDLLATGGTAQATGELVAQTGALVVAYAFLIELTSLGGREKLTPLEIVSVLKY